MSAASSKEPPWASFTIDVSGHMLYVNADVRRMACYWMQTTQTECTQSNHLETLLH
jgi:hypothetical protein